MVLCWKTKAFMDLHEEAFFFSPANELNTSHNSHVKSRAAFCCISVRSIDFPAMTSLPGIFPFCPGKWSHSNLLYWSLRGQTNRNISPPHSVLAWSSTSAQLRVGELVRQQFTSGAGSNGWRCHAYRILNFVLFAFFFLFKCSDANLSVSLLHDEHISPRVLGKLICFDFDKVRGALRKPEGSIYNATLIIRFSVMQVLGN